MKNLPHSYLSPAVACHSIASHTKLGPVHFSADIIHSVLNYWPCLHPRMCYSQIRSSLIRLARYTRVFDTAAHIPCCNKNTDQVSYMYGNVLTTEPGKLYTNLRQYGEYLTSTEIQRKQHKNHFCL